MRILRIMLPLLVAAAGVLVPFCLIRIEPDEIGVRTLNFGADHGIVQQDYGPGYHRNLWPLDTWNRFPSTVLHICFTSDNSGGLRTTDRPLGDLQLTSADGDRVNMIVDVAFRIAPGQAHRVLQDSGLEHRRYEDVVRNLSQDAMRVFFGRLRTEAFYSESSREGARQQAAEMLRGRLTERGIELIDMLVQAVKFDPHYEELIKKKKIADQSVELQKAQAKAAEETGKVAKIDAETKVKVEKVGKELDAAVLKLRTETGLQAKALAGEAGRYAAQKEADAKLYQSEKQAEGDRLVKLAEAEGALRLNLALAGEGGRNLVALEAAKEMNLQDVTFPSFGFDWFNPNAMAMRLGATSVMVPATQPSEAMTAAR
jgi:hypothetical protein